MSDFLHPDNDFLRKTIAIIEENLSDENFEVPDLAERMSMSRSNLLRKVKSLSGFSVSVFIRQVRLHHAKQMLLDDSLTISEVSFKVGFSSTSYFTKCFRETFGYPPGEEKKNVEKNQRQETISSSKKKLPGWILVLVALAIISVMFLLNNDQEAEPPLEKSIAVLPFKNDSNDTSNVYIINGLMESVLDNLQRIEDLQVTSRTTVEKYRSVVKTIPELSKELEVNYFVEGSGQKIGDQILLTIQLIDGRNDRHLWSQQYERETKDIFKLQMEVAKNIASEIEAVITPEEKRLIEKVLTENFQAYDFYLKGRDLTKDMTYESLVGGIDFFQKAIEADESFAAAYAYLAICYYYLDLYQADKQYKEEINTNADKALLFDAELAHSLIAKALYYKQDKQFELAIDYFEKALKYSPNSGPIHNFLSDIYANYLPNTERYLTHALKGIRVAVSVQDSTAASYSYLHLSNALVQNGFIKEAKKYVVKSIDHDPNNLFSEYLATYIGLAENFDLKQAKERLILTLAKDTTRIDIIQELAKVCYAMEDYEAAWSYYEKFEMLKEAWGLDVFQSEDVKIGFVLDQLGEKKEALTYYERFWNYAESDQTIYRDLNKSAYYAATGDVEKGIEFLEAFTKQSDYLYWIVLFLEDDPIIGQLATHPDFEEITKRINENFWTKHRQLRDMLVKDGVM